MNKYITVLLLMMSPVAFSQIGVSTATPNANSDLDLGAVNKALYLNRVANTGAVADPQPGMIVYDQSSNCVKVYEGDPAKWSDCLGAVVGTITSLTCSSGVFSPATAIQGQAYTGTLTLPYIGGNGGTYAAQSFTQNGLVFMLPAGSFNTGAGNIVYNITGTPTLSGITVVNITAGGQGCNVQLTVN